MAHVFFQQDLHAHGHAYIYYGCHKMYLSTVVAGSIPGSTYLCINQKPKDYVYYEL